MYWTPTEHLLQLSCMAIIIFGAQAISRQAHHRRLRKEAQRLRSALVIGLTSLSRVYGDDADVLAHQPRRLVSGRNQMNLMRTQLGRIMTPDEEEVEAVRTACIAAERAETWLDIAGRRLGGPAMPVPQRDDLRATLKSTLDDATRQLQAAVDVLDPEEGVRRRIGMPLPPVGVPERVVERRASLLSAEI